MNTTRGARRIFWLVRLLGALGLAIVVVMIGQSGLQLKSIRTSPKISVFPVRRL
jgi:hypothetical protein